MEARLNTEELFKEVICEISPVLQRAEPEQLEKAAEEICAARKIFVAGMGRTSYMMRCFAMRLMQMGLSAYMVGDTSTPSANEGDLLIIGSGSGETESLKAFAAKAKKRNVKILVITASAKSTLAKASDYLVLVDTREKEHKTPDGAMIIQKTDNSGQRMALGSMCELSTLIYTEVISMLVFSKLGCSEEDMMRRHATFE